MFAGYDMQFDIKYAYFNFLKSIQYRSIHDPTLPETASKDTDTESDCDSIAYGFKDEFSANGSVENLAGGSTKEEWVFDLIAWVLNCSCVGFFRAGKKQRSQKEDIGIVTGKKVAWRMKILNTWMGTLMFSCSFGLSISILMHFLSQKNFEEWSTKIDVALFQYMNLLGKFFKVDGLKWSILKYNDDEIYAI